jgi:16S rRNA (cytosine967-C5)-methyltransferase
VELLDVKPGMKVLDFCSAPGGKTIQCAWRLGGKESGARLVAQEVNPARRRLLAENLKRVGAGWVETVAEGDAEARFDRVLADVPCSNTGVLRRRPDARWNWTREHLAELVKLQSEIFARAAERVVSGGLIVYSTCSNEPEENEGQIAAFLAAHPDFEEVGRKESVPFVSGRDGAFACALRRR